MSKGTSKPYHRRLPREGDVSTKNEGKLDVTT